MSTVADVTKCTMSACAFNDNGCTAYAVTIAGSPQNASCGTFIELDGHGGLPKAEAHVGACQRTECAHNTDLMCGISAITVGAAGDGAGCLMYEAR